MPNKVGVVHELLSLQLEPIEGSNLRNLCPKRLEMMVFLTYPQASLLHCVGSKLLITNRLVLDSKRYLICTQVTCAPPDSSPYHLVDRWDHTDLAIVVLL